MDQFEKARLKSEKRTAYYQSRDPNYGKTFVDATPVNVAPEPVKIVVAEPPKKSISGDAYLDISIRCAHLDFNVQYKIRAVLGTIPAAQLTEERLKRMIKDGLIAQFGNMVE